MGMAQGPRREKGDNRRGTESVNEDSKTTHLQLNIKSCIIFRNLSEFLSTSFGL
jgi:hypothetical protein